MFVWDRSTLKGKIYIDGKLNSETASTYKGSDIDLNLTNHTLYELGFKKDTKDVFNGYLRDLAVFLRPLTPGEVSTLYSKFLWWVSMNYLMALYEQCSSKVLTSRYVGQKGC